MADKYDTTEVTITAVTEQAGVEHLAVPPTFVKPKRIHPRRRLPEVRIGRAREFHSMSPELALFRAMPAEAAAATGIALDTDTPLTAPGAQSTAASVDGNNDAPLYFNF